MSFHFNWPAFDNDFYNEAKKQLETALNRETKSKYIADTIVVKELHMGSKPPELEILEIGELSTDYFRGIFKLTYSGDSYIELQTKIQANPLYSPPPKNIGLPMYRRPNIVAAAQPMYIPMLLRISHVKLNGIIVLSVSKTKGVTLVFKNDALEQLKVSSTFDIVPTVKIFLQNLIESQLRAFLQDSLPIVVHEYSLRHTDQQRSTLPIYSPSTPFDDFDDLPDLIDTCSDTSSECLSWFSNDPDDTIQSVDSTCNSSLSHDTINIDDLPTGLIQRLNHLSRSSHTLSLANPLPIMVVHKTAARSVSRQPRTTKIPKRRIIRWNPN